MNKLSAFMILWKKAIDTAIKEKQFKIETFLVQIPKQKGPNTPSNNISSFLHSFMNKITYLITI